MPHTSGCREEERRMKVLRRIVGIIAALALLTGVVGVIVYGYKTRPGWVGVSDKKFWDYLELLIVPAVLAIGVAWLNWAQRKREREAEEAQQARELEVENQRAQDEALQAYLDQMSAMLLPNKDRPSLYKARPGDSLSSVARARTLTVLPRLDSDRKARVIQFLYESGLITRRRPVLNLDGADLTEADLEQANLVEATLGGTNLSGARLSGARLAGADLFEADLSGAELVGAVLTATPVRVDPYVSLWE
jgi:uncharacterized membrane protein